MNIFVSNADDTGEGVMIFTDKWTLQQVIDRLDKAGFYYDDIYEVKSEDVQYFIYEPLWI